MNFLKKIVLTACISLLFTTTSCQNKYPELEKGIYAKFNTTKGVMIAKLYYDKVPLTVANFVGLAEGSHPKLNDSLKGIPYYNETIFHRVIDKFMIQGGDPSGTGMGKAGYTFNDEFHDSLKHDKPGVLSMANSGPNTNGSQFFITEVPTPWLDRKHSIFGQIVKGINVQDSISNVEVMPGSNKPLEKIKIKSLNIIRIGTEARNFDASKIWERELPLIEKRRLDKENELKRKIEQNQKIALRKNNEYKTKSKSTNSGLLYYTLKPGNGKKPKKGENIKLLYEGYFVDGKLFSTNIKSIDKNFGTFNNIKEQRRMYEPMSMLYSDDAQMIPGFKEGVFKMTYGEKIFLYIPSYLAYGEQARGPIKPNSDLIFIVELLKN